MATPTRYERINGKGWYFRPCDDCDVEIRDTNKDMHPRCFECGRLASIKWTPEAILAAMQKFAERYGYQPAATDWDTSRLTRSTILGGSRDGLLRPDYANEALRRWREDGPWPTQATVLRIFGSWNAGLEAAGFVSVAPGKNRPVREAA